MMFDKVSIRNLRCIEAMELSFSAGMNLITGDNGAGKTSLLEAVYLLVMGRSFRHRESAPLIRESEQGMELVGHLFDAHGGRHVLGMRRTKNDLEVRLDGRSRVKRSEILALSPLHFIGAEPQRLVAGEPELRRNFIDAGLFHVEPRHLKNLQRYGRVLEQRNFALRMGGQPLAQWDEQLARIGTWIDTARRSHVKELEGRAADILGYWEMGIEIAFSYRSGWSRGEGLEESLAKHIESDRKNRFTGPGPHRADWIIQGKMARSGKLLSRGQLKMLASALYLAQAETLAASSGVMPILLYDDLAAELDRKNRRRLLDTLQDRYRQVLVTALEPQDLALTPPVQWFHVEHGKLTEG